MGIIIEGYLVYCASMCLRALHTRENIEMFYDTTYATKIYSLCYNSSIHHIPELDDENRGFYEQIGPLV